MSTARGAFITLEGADGAGKTTQLAYIREWLEDRDFDLVVTREPGGTPFGEALRTVLLDKQSLEICDEAELLTVFAARQQHIHERILPSMQSGKWVLSDRFTDASYAYQGGGRGIDASRIKVLEKWVQGSLQPDLTILLDVDVALGNQRSGDRGAQVDRFERESMSFKTAVRESYLSRALAAKGRIRVIDASGTIEEVQRNIAKVLGDFCDEFVQGQLAPGTVI